MTTLAGVFIALGLVTSAWISRVQVAAKDQPHPAPSVAGWVLGLIGTLVLLLVALGVVVVR
jgi:hypothetical protein